MLNVRTMLCLGIVGWLSGCAGTAPDPAAMHPAVAINPDPMLGRGPWVLVDTRKDTLSIMLENRPMEVFHHIAVGSRGPGTKRMRGDNVTPVGVFRIGWINPNSRFKLFFGLDYPNLEYADKAYREGRIDRDTYDHIRFSVSQGLTPPQDTPLGGSIGIHGVGAGDPWVHANLDWTNGCIALDNRQIERLAQWVGVGTRVEIR